MRTGDRRRLLLVPLLAVLGLGAAGAADAPLARAVEDRDHARLRALLAEGADVNAAAPDGTTALHWAAHWSDREAARLLVRAGADVDAVNRYGATPLWLAAERAAGRRGRPAARGRRRRERARARRRGVAADGGGPRRRRGEPSSCSWRTAPTSTRGTAGAGRRR